MKRRGFIQTTGQAISLSALNYLRTPFSLTSNPLKVVLIGCGWYGKGDLMRLLQIADVEVVALCDPDSRQAKEAQEWVKQRIAHSPVVYRDHREMLSRHPVELAIIGSPDHWHALHAIDAMKAGAHLYLQKPISMDVLEGEAILKTARMLDKKVQVGTQRRSTHHLIEAKKNIIESGLIGKVTHVEMCCYYHMRAHLDDSIVPVPDHLDYDLWVGPAPMLPYTASPHRGYWRAKMEYSNGIMGDMCVHMYDTARWMLGLGWPDEIYSSGGIYVQKESAANTPDTQMAVFKHEELECVWHHRSYGSAVDPKFPWAVIFYGEHGVLKADVHKYEFTPHNSDQIITGSVLYEREEYPQDLEERDIELHTAAANRQHMADLLTSIQNDSTPVADIEEGHISTASCILANISMQLGRSLKFDPTSKTVIGDQDATDLLIRPYRKGWKHPHWR